MLPMQDILVFRYLSDGLIVRFCQRNGRNQHITGATWQRRENVRHDSSSKVIESFVLDLRQELGVYPKTMAQWRKHMTVADIKSVLEEACSAPLGEPEWLVVMVFRIQTLFPEVRGD